jgi:hypothetical protein
MILLREDNMWSNLSADKIREFFFTEHCADLCFSWIMPVIAIGFAIIIFLVLKFIPNCCMEDCC